MVILLVIFDIISTGVLLLLSSSPFSSVGGSWGNERPCAASCTAASSYDNIVIVTFRHLSHYNTTTHNYLTGTPLFTNIFCTDFVLVVNHCISVFIVTFRLWYYRTTNPTRIVRIKYS
jgi:hypothetical protein